MMPSLSNLLSNRLLVARASAAASESISVESIPIPNLKARLLASDQLLDNIGFVYTDETAQAILMLEMQIDECIVNSQVENGQLTCWLQDEFGTSRRETFDVSSWVDGSRFGKSDRAIAYQKLIAAQMIRHGYSIHEEPGIGFTVLALTGESAFTNLVRCDCGGKQHPCEHILLAREYSSPGNRRLLKEVIGFEYVPSHH